VNLRIILTITNKTYDRRKAALVSVSKETTEEKLAQTLAEISPQLLQELGRLVKGQPIDLDKGVSK
jgi:hypothetical protein